MLRNLVSLVFAEAIDVVKDAGKVGWPVKLYFVKRLVVGVKNSLHGVDLWIENVTVECKTVGCSIARGTRNFPSKPIRRVHLIGIIILHNPKHCLNCFYIIVCKILWIQIMQRLRGVWLSVRQRVVNCHVNSYVASPENIVQKRDARFD